MNKEPVQVINAVPFTVTVRIGGSGNGWLMMNVPAFTKNLGGDTGGVVKIGRISLRAMRARSELRVGGRRVASTL